MLDDIYQYHLPPKRRVPPLLWTRLRADLPDYLTDSEADGVIVISWYHRQFRSGQGQQMYCRQICHFNGVGGNNLMNGIFAILDILHTFEMH